MHRLLSALLLHLLVATPAWALLSVTTTTALETSTDTPDTSTGGPDTTPCPESCVNGVDRGCCSASCNCDVKNETYFNGTRCDSIILQDIVNVTTSPRTCNLTWEFPPNITEEKYEFVYIVTGCVDNSTKCKNGQVKIHNISSMQFNMITEDTARLIELEAGGVMYTVCVLDKMETLNLTTNELNERLNASRYSDCVEVTTQFTVLWRATLAFYITAALMILTLTLLIIIKLLTDRIQAPRQAPPDTPDTASVDSDEEEKPKKRMRRKKASAPADGRTDTEIVPINSKEGALTGALQQKTYTSGVAPPVHGVDNKAFTVDEVSGTNPKPGTVGDVSGAAGEPDADY